MTTRYSEIFSRKVGILPVCAMVVAWIAFLIAPLAAAANDSGECPRKAAASGVVEANKEVGPDKKKVGKGGPRPKGALHTSGGGVFDVGTYQLTLRHVYFVQDQFFEGSSKVETEVPGPSKRTAHNYQLAFRAGVVDNFDLRVMVPFTDREMQRQTRREKITESHFGLGDIRLIGRYRLLSQKAGWPLNLAVGAGLKMPTGETNKQGDGRGLPGFLQPGTGSWDPILELAAHKVAGRYRFGGNVMYRMSTSGKRGGQDFTAPSDFAYNVAYVYALTKYFDAILELNGRYATKAEMDGQTQENSGGHTLFLVPGMNIKFTSNLHLSLGVPVMIHRDLNGRQLSEDYRISSKLVYAF